MIFGVYYDSTVRMPRIGYAKDCRNKPMIKKISQHYWRVPISQDRKNKLGLKKDKQDCRNKPGLKG